MDDNVPVEQDPNEIISGPCELPEGGTPTVQGPKYVLVVTNPE